MRPPLLRALRYGLLLRCPNCHQGRLFRGWINRMFRSCPHCGLSYFRESGYYLGGMIITYILVAIVLIAVYFAALLVPGAPAAAFSGNKTFAMWILFTILLTFLFVRPSYSMWLALDFWLEPWEPGEPK